MKKILLFLITTGTSSLISFAQSADPSVVASSGGNYEGTDMQVSWTLGETVIATISDGNTTLTQGFHQETYEIIGLEETIKNEDYEVNLFPNPTDNLINCEIKNNENIQKIIFRIMDSKGNTIDLKEFKEVQSKEFETKFDLTSSAPGEYFIQIMNDEYNKSFKVIKK